jgi:hypothetical protein
MKAKKVEVGQSVNQSHGEGPLVERVRHQGKAFLIDKNPDAIPKAFLLIR